MDRKEEWDVAGTATQGGSVVVLLQSNRDQIGFVWFHRGQTKVVNVITFNRYGKEPKVLSEALIKGFLKYQETYHPGRGDYEADPHWEWVIENLDEITK